MESTSCNELIMSLLNQNNLADEVVKALESYSEYQNLFNQDLAQDDFTLNCINQKELNFESEEFLTFYKEKVKKISHVENHLVETQEISETIRNRVSKMLEDIEVLCVKNEKVLNQLKKLKQARWLAEWKQKIVAGIIRTLSVSQNFEVFFTSTISNINDLDSCVFSTYAEVQRVHDNVTYLDKLLKTLEKDVCTCSMETINTYTCNKPASFDPLVIEDVIKATKELLILGEEKIFNLTLKEISRLKDLINFFPTSFDNLSTKHASKFLCLSKAIKIIRAKSCLFQLFIEKLVTNRAELFKNRILYSSALRDDDTVFFKKTFSLYADSFKSMISLGPILSMLRNAYEAVVEERQLAFYIFFENLDNVLQNNVTETLQKLVCNINTENCDVNTQNSSGHLTYLKEESKNCDFSQNTESHLEYDAYKLPFLNDENNFHTKEMMHSTEHPTMENIDQKTTNYSEFLDNIIQDCPIYIQEEIGKKMNDLQLSALDVSKTFHLLCCFCFHLFRLMQPKPIAEELNILLGSNKAEQSVQNAVCSKFTHRCLDLCYFIFEKTSAAWMKQIILIEKQIKTQAPSPQCSIPICLHEFVSDLNEVFNSLTHLRHLSPSLLHSIRSDAGIIRNISQIAVAPLLNIINRSAHTTHTSLSKAIYLLNCFQIIQEKLSTHTFLENYFTIYHQLIDENVDVIVKNECTNALTTLGFLPRLTQLREWRSLSAAEKEKQPLSAKSSLHPLSVSACLQSFHDMIILNGSIKLDNLDKISSIQTQETIKKRVLNSIISAYQELSTGVNYVDLVSYTPEQLRKLLSV